jgi:hypothetical protein
MLTSRTNEYYETRAKKLQANGKENQAIVKKLRRQARKAKNK